MKTFFPRQAHIHIEYRNCKNFDNSVFRYELCNKFVREGNHTGYEHFETIFMGERNKLKEKDIRANTTPYMSKALSKAIMKRSRLRNKF